MATFLEMIEGIQRGEWWQRPHHKRVHPEEYIRIGIVQWWNIQAAGGNIGDCGFCSYRIDLRDYHATDWEPSEKKWDQEAMASRQRLKERRENKERR